VPVELWGNAEAAAETLEAGDEVLITGAKLKYKSMVDAKTQAKVSKLVISSRGVAQRIPAPSESAQDERSDVDPSPGMSIEVVDGPGGERRPSQKGKPRYPKTTKERWVPSGLASEN
jgi:hypothetical protein